MNNPVLKFLLAPFALLYGASIGLRNLVYNLEIVKSIEFNLPVISIGNLTMGGSGKTPHIEYLIDLLKDYVEIATLSRGYGRKTKGFFFVRSRDRAELVGDEPLQYASKYPDISVAIAENRVIGINNIVMHQPAIKTVLLDDAFQHRSIKPGLNILLTEYAFPFTRDFLLPVGRLREWRAGYRRADIIVVSKCPPGLNESDKESIKKEINPFSHQSIYFSRYDYLNPYSLYDSNYTREIKESDNIILISAIARTDYLLDYIEEKVQEINYIEFEDHHYFNPSDLERINKLYQKLPTQNRYVLTTEKDAMRLRSHIPWLAEHKIPVMILPIKVKFLDDDSTRFNEQIQNYLLNFKV